MQQQKTRFSLPSGESIKFLHPEITTIHKEDLYQGLKRKYRYSGLLPVTVIHHLVICRRLSEMAGNSPLVTAYCSAHDLHEAIVGEVVTAIKELLPEWQGIEDRWEMHVHNSLGLRWPLAPSIKHQVKGIDYKALAVETTYYDWVDAPVIQEKYGMPTKAELKMADNILGRQVDQVQRHLFEEVWQSIKFVTENQQRS